MTELSTFKVDSEAAYRVGFLILENFTMMSLASAMEPIRMANHLSGKRLYDWKLIGATTEQVMSSGGVKIVPDVSLLSPNEFDLVLVVAGINVKDALNADIIRWLRSISKKVQRIGGLCTGAYALARAGLLDGYSASAHWECLAALQEEYPLVFCNNHLFTFDRNRMTCTGGDVPLHMMIHLVASQRGQAIANGIIDMFVCERIRDSHEPQRLRMESKLFANQPKLATAVQLMEANIEELIDLSEVASYSSVSRRQLERLFLTNLSVTPSRFYLKLRLERAKQLLTQTSCSVVEISTMCGFVSAPHFSRCYRKHMGCSPTGERENRNGFGAGIVLSEESAGLVPSESDASLGKARRETSFGRLSE